MPIVMNDRPGFLSARQDVETQIKVIQQNFVDIWNKVHVLVEAINKLEKKVTKG